MATEVGSLNVTLKSESTYVWELHFTTWVTNADDTLSKEFAVIHVTEDSMLTQLHVAGVLLIKMSTKGKWIPVLDKEQFKYVTHVGEPKMSMTIDKFWTDLWNMSLGDSKQFSDKLKITCIQRPQLESTVAVDAQKGYKKLHKSKQKFNNYDKQAQYYAQKSPIKYHEENKYVAFVEDEVYDPSLWKDSGVSAKNMMQVKEMQEQEKIQEEAKTLAKKPLYYYVDIDDGQMVVLYMGGKRYTVQFQFGSYHDLPEVWPEDVKQFLNLGILPYKEKKKLAKNAEDMPQDPRFTLQVKHPVDNHKQNLADIVISLNDNHKWTREQIADWLDTLDEQPKFVFKGPTGQIQETSWGVYPFTSMDEMQSA